MRYEVSSKPLKANERTIAQFSYFEIRAENEQECEQLAAYLTKHKELHGRSETPPTNDDVVNAAQRFFSEPLKEYERKQLKSETLQQMSEYKMCSLLSYRRSPHACTLPFRVESVRYALRAE